VGTVFIIRIISTRSASTLERRRLRLPRLREAGIELNQRVDGLRLPRLGETGIEFNRRVLREAEFDGLRGRG
jgi:hypothetical protein